MTLATYIIGPPKRPNITHDNGHLDQFQRRAPTVSEHMQYKYWQGKLELAEAGQDVPFLPHNDIPDALAAYRHFLDGSGLSRTINFERYIQYDTSGQITFKNIVVEAKSGAIDLFQRGKLLVGGTTSFSGSGLVANSGNTKFPYPATENWQKAIGAYNFWISGDVSVELDQSKRPGFDLLLTIHVEDMYNFNPGAADIATGIPDEANGIFEVNGLAKQYLNVADITRRLLWNGTSPGGYHKVTGVPGRRARKPGDNRRVRNRL